jgi:two-component system LytT family response regulator
MSIPIKILVIDDEQTARHNIKKIIKQFCPGYEVVGEAATALEGVKLINTLNPDIILLDIEMPGGSGFDMLDAIANVNASIIFITAYNQYAIKAFKYNAIDYLLKPVDIDDLNNALTKAATNSKSTQSIQPILDDIKHNNPLRLAIVNQNETEYVKIDSITHMEASGSYTAIFLENSKSYMVSRNLKSFEESLTDYSFLRVHNSYLLNLSHVVKYSKKDGYTAFTSNGVSIPIATRKKEIFESLINKLSK